MYTIAIYHLQARLLNKAHVDAKHVKSRESGGMPPRKFSGSIFNDLYYDPCIRIGRDRSN